MLPILFVFLRLVETRLLPDLPVSLWGDLLEDPLRVVRVLLDEFCQIIQIVELPVDEVSRFDLEGDFESLY